MRNKMIRKVLIVLILVSYVVSDSCVRYTFEQNFNELFTHQRHLCLSSDKLWVLGKYNDIDLSNENDQSTNFIKPAPLSAFTCVSSFSFPMAPGGTIEVNTYRERSTSSAVDFIMIAVYQLGIPDLWLGDAVHNYYIPGLPGWHTLKIIIPAYAGIGDGYISILGRASQNSIVLIDSFRYIPPDMEESACRLYEDEPATTLEPTTYVPPTPEVVTLEPTPPQEITPDPTMPEETTPVQTTPEVTTPDPITPEVITPEPTTPEETTPDQITPEVTMPEVTTPEMVTPDPSMPEETTPEPTMPEETTPVQTTPEETTPNPTTPEETTPDPTTPEVTTPENKFLLTIETWIKTELSTSRKTI